jgi:hypothetical protein
MKLYVTRGSVTAADDVDAPHRLQIAGPATGDVGAAIKDVLATGYLPRIVGGKATWSVVSNRPIAVVAQQWAKPRLLDTYDTSFKGLDVGDGRLRLHFNYHAQLDPEMVVEVLWGFRLNAV